MFRLRAEGHLSDTEIVAKVNALGYRTKRFKRWNKTKDTVIGYSRPGPLTVKRFQEIIQRPIYCGVRVEKWTEGKPVRTQYPGLVSIATFNKANRGKVEIEERADGTLSIHYGSRRCPVRLKNNPLYPYKNVVMCPKCRTKPVLGSASKGKRKHYPAYHCDRGHYYRVPKVHFEDAVDGYLDTLRLKPKYRKHYENAMRRVWSRRQEEVAKVRAQVEENVSELRTQQEAAVESLIGASPLVRQKLEARILELEDQIQAALQHHGEDVSKDDFEGFIAWTLKLLEHPVQMLKDPSNIERQRGQFDIIFAEPPTFEQMANGTPKLGCPFRLGWLFDEPESVSVPQQEFTWNSVRPMIAKWKQFVKGD